MPSQWEDHLDAANKLRGIQSALPTNISGWQAFSK